MAVKAATIKNNQPGFTLVETLLVLVIIAVMAGLLSVAVGPNPHNILEREARRLQAVLQIAADEAVMQGVQWALALSEQGYQFLVFDNDDLHWRSVETDPFNAHDVDNTIILTLTVEGEQLDPQALTQIQRMQSLSADQSLQPVLLLLSSGEITPFTLMFSHVELDDRIMLRSDGVSPIELVHEGTR